MSLPNFGQQTSTRSAPPPLVVSKQYAYAQFSIETLIDAGLATPEEIAEYEAHQPAPLPWPVRRWRHLRYGTLPRWQYNVNHAWRAIRGIDCERD